MKILRDGEQTFPAMFAAIHAARHYLLLEYYIFEDVSSNGEQLADLLVSKAQSGVQVDVIYDGIGSIGTAADVLRPSADRRGAAGAVQSAQPAEGRAAAFPSTIGIIARC